MLSLAKKLFVKIAMQDLNASKSGPFYKKLFNFVLSMKKIAIIILLAFQLIVFTQSNVSAQCALCTKTAQQMGEKPAQGLNSGILYLMIMPFAIVGFIGFRWWKNNKHVEDEG